MKSYSDARRLAQDILPNLPLQFSHDRITYRLNLYNDDDGCSVAEYDAFNNPPILSVRLDSRDICRAATMLLADYQRLRDKHPRLKKVNIMT